jgi:CMP-N-acetylneuraminic acid synthetase
MSIPMLKAMVPMRAHSERVPNKNIRDLAGRPCFHWIVDSLLKSRYIDEVIINTDSPEIAKSASDNFKVTVLERPEYLRGYDISIQPLIEFDLAHSDGTFYLQTHSTNPLVSTDTINKAIEAFFSQQEHDTLFSVTEIKQRFYTKDGKGVNHDPARLVPTQNLEPIFHENSCFYIFSRETNMKTKNRLGVNPMMFPIDRLEAADIDDIEDFYWAEFLLERKLKAGEKK